MLGACSERAVATRRPHRPSPSIDVTGADYAKELCPDRIHNGQGPHAGKDFPGKIGGHVLWLHAVSRTSAPRHDDRAGGECKKHPGLPTATSCRASSSRSTPSAIRPRCMKAYMANFRSPASWRSMRDNPEIRPRPPWPRTTRSIYKKVAGQDCKGSYTMDHTGGACTCLRHPGPQGAPVFALRQPEPGALAVDIQHAACPAELKQTTRLQKESPRKAGFLFARGRHLGARRRCSLHLACARSAMIWMQRQRMPCRPCMRRSTVLRTHCRRPLASLAGTGADAPRGCARPVADAAADESVDHRVGASETGHAPRPFQDFELEVLHARLRYRLGTFGARVLQARPRSTPSRRTLPASGIDAWASSRRAAWRAGLSTRPSCMAVT